MRNCSWIRGSVLLALAAGMALLQSDGNAGQQQNNGFAAAAWPLNVRAPMPASPIWRGLNYVIETRDFQQELSLKELLSIVYERLHSDALNCLSPSTPKHSRRFCLIPSTYSILRSFFHHCLPG